MVMWKFKSCPRCGGDLFLERDLDGWYEHCLQCSYAHKLENLDKPEKQPVDGEREPVGAKG